jgi:hypothetical protein
MMILFVATFTLISMALIMGLFYGAAALADRAEAKKFEESKPVKVELEVLDEDTVEQIAFKQQQRWERDFAEATGKFNPEVFIEQQVTAQLDGSLGLRGYFELLEPYMPKEIADSTLLYAEMAKFKEAYQSVDLGEGYVRVSPSPDPPLEQPLNLPQTTSPLMRGDTAFLQRHLMVLEDMQKRNPDMYRTFEWRKKDTKSNLDGKYLSLAEEYKQISKNDLMLTDRALELGQRDIRNRLNLIPKGDPRTIDMLAKYRDFTRRRQIILNIER